MGIIQNHRKQKLSFKINTRMGQLLRVKQGGPEQGDNGSADTVLGMGAAVPAPWTWEGEYE